MFKQCYVILILSCAFTIKAQDIQFNRLYDDYNAWESIQQVIELSDSSILLTSRTLDVFATDSTYNRRLYFNLLDHKGDKKNGLILSYQNQDFIYVQPMIKRGAEYFTIASFNNLDSTNGRGYYAKGIYVNAPLTDTLRSFNIIYHYFPNGNPSFNPQPLVVSDGTFLNHASYTGTYGDSIYLFWSDSLGNVIRVKEYPQLHMKIYKIIETPDKGFLLIGKQFEEEKYIVNSTFELIYVGHPERLWYIKIDCFGNLKWQKLLTGPDYELYDTISFKYKLCTETSFRDAIQTGDGNYVMAGFIENNPYIRKVNENGDAIWEETFFKEITYLDSLKRRAFFINLIEEKGQLYCLGYKDTLFANAQVKQSIPFLMKLTASGKEVWTRYFNAGPNNYLYNVFPSRYGFYLSGSKHDTTPKYGSQDAWLMRIDTNGCLISGCDLNNGLEPVPFLSNKGILIYPNPANTTLTIQSTEHYTTIEIWNMMGNLVNKQTEPTSTIDVSALPQGLYILRMLGPQQEVIGIQKVRVSH